MENPSLAMGAGGLDQVHRLVAFKTTAAIIQQQYFQHHQQQEKLPEDDDMAEPCSEPLNFHVEDLLDLPPDDEPAAPPLCLPSCGEGQLHHQEESVSCAQRDYPQQDGLYAPPAELADELEWLSAFHEDSSYSCDATLVSLATIKDNDCAANSSSGQQHLATNSNCLVPSRARSKRSHSGTGHPWSMDARVPTLVDNTLGGACENNVFINERRARGIRSSFINQGDQSDGAAQSNAVSADCRERSTLSVSRAGQSTVSFVRGATWCHSPFLSKSEHCKRPKKAKKTSAFASFPFSSSSSSSSSGDGLPLRRCSHCLVQKTPQWRAGPLGPKTLCNACGVRYKSGRLVPEYRPASSPTFVSDVHSNSHRKILEMRRIKEVAEARKESEQSSKSSDVGNHHMEEEPCHSRSRSCMTSLSQTLHSQCQNTKMEEDEEHDSKSSDGTHAKAVSHMVVTPLGDETEESINSSVSCD